jgi:hypothetical protein
MVVEYKQGVKKQQNGDKEAKDDNNNLDMP